VKLTDIPLMAMLKGKMGYLNQRQNVIAQNVANADTPDYAPRDLKPFTFDEVLRVSDAASGALQARRTNPGHLAVEAQSGARFGDQLKEDSEIRLDGNHVVLEEQMIKLSNARMDYDAAVGFYQQSLGLLKLAVKKPGS
jgi:flagellar basal-body rod protein FlgB